MNSTGYLTYVSEMLSTHDAVVIPGFGGFVTKYKPARIVEEAGHIHPPTKYIAFNEQLDIHDNTFARFLDEKTSAHYSPRLFDYFLANLKSDLESNQVIIVPKVGRLYQDFEGMMHFMPDLLNLNNDTFGLPQLASTKGEWAKSTIRQAAQELKNGSLRTALSSAATVAFLFILAWVGSGSLGSNDNLGTTELSVIDAITETKAPEHLKEKEVPLIEQKEEIQPATSDVIEVPTLPVVSAGQKAIIIVGAFGSPANADKMIREVESLGYNGYQDRPRKLNRVGVEVSYTSEEELDSILTTVQKRITSRAWILK